MASASLRLSGRILMGFAIALLFSVSVSAQSDKAVQMIERNKTDNTPKSIIFSSETSLKDDAAATAKLFEQYLGVDGINNTMKQSYRTTTKSGVTTTRYNQYYKGIPVAYGSYTLTSRNGTVSFMAGNYYNVGFGVSTVPTVSEPDAFAKALEFVGAVKYMWEDPQEEQRIKAMYRKTDTTFKPTGTLRLIEDHRADVRDRKLHLAWVFSIYAQQPLSRQEVYVDAITGQILFSNPLIKHTAASGKSKYSGVVNFQTSDLGSTFQLFDSTRGTGVHTLNMNNGTSYGAATEYNSVANIWPLLPADSIALDAHWAGGIVYDYWLAEQGRHSYDNFDGMMLQYVHYGSGFNNAFWDGFEMTYGDGSGCASGFNPLASLDVTAHEIGHGVCQYTSDLVYEMESGAINEAFSDCWGATIEAYANPGEVDAVAKSTWAMGEEIDCGTPLRRMDFPKLRNDPDTYTGTYWVSQVSCVPTSGNDHCGVHTNSGVMNKWYYLVVNGGAGTNDLSNAYSVTGIGFTDAANILYQTELSLSTTADYAELRTTSINMATILFGGCSQQVRTVTDAWYAVGVGPAYVPFPANITGSTNICIGGTTLLSDATPGGTWSSSFPLIATITAGGLVTGVAAGIDTIFYSVGVGCDAKTIVTVNAAPSATITPSPTASMCAGGSVVLTAGSGVGYVYQWKLAGGNIPGATNITYNATAAGNYTVQVNITAGCLATSAITTVNTVALPLAMITPASSTTFCDGNSVLLNANLGVGYTYQWQLGGTPIAGATGLSYTATTAGNYSVIVTNPAGCSATSANTAVIVNPLPAPISGADVLCVGLTSTLSSAPAGAWSSSNAAVASVGSSTGVVTGITTGVASITYRLSTGCYETLPVTVNTVPAAITGIPNVCQGLMTTLSNAVPGGSWSSSNTSIASVSTAGVVTGITAGPATITYTMGAGCFTAQGVVVNPLPAAITGVQSVCSGATTTLSSASTGGTWASGSTPVATVSLTGGLVTGITGGVAPITYTIPATGCITTANVTVNTVTAAPITGPTSVCIGQTILLTDATAGGTWTSSNPAIAIVNPTGTVIGVAAGTANITYTVMNPCGSAFVISPVAVNSLPVVSPVSGTLSVCSGNSAAVTDATPAGVWSSGNTAIATVSSTGIVTGVSAGTANISYTVTNSAGCVNSAVAPFNVFYTFTVSVTPPGPLNVCTGASVVLNASTGTGYTYQWKKNGAIIAGATTTSFAASTTGTYNMLETAPGGCNSLSAPVIVNVDPTRSVVIPSVSFSAHPGMTLCAAGTSDTFAASAAFGGSSPTYQWFVNGVPRATGGTFNYIPSHNDVVRVVLTSDEACAYPATAVKSDTVKVSAPVTATVTISGGAGTACYGERTTYTAVSTYGGSSPSYSWTVNGVYVGAGISYSYVPTNGDVLKCTMISNYPCVMTSAVTSPALTINVIARVPHTVSITSSHTGASSGTAITFYAVAPYGGTSPAYQWYINSVAVPGATNATYTTAGLMNNDEVSCTVTSSNPCASPKSVRSSGIKMQIWGVGVQEVAGIGGNFILTPNPSKGTFTISGALMNSSNEEVHITVTNLLGQMVYETTTIARNGIVSQAVVLDNAVTNSVYLVSVATNKGREVFRMIIDK